MPEHSSPTPDPLSHDAQEDFELDLGDPGLDHLRFWDRCRDGISIAVGSSETHKLLGTRDAFETYLERILKQDTPLQVLPHGDVEQSDRLPMTDEEAIWAARHECLELEDRLGSTCHFYVGNEGGLHGLDVEGQTRYFVRSWTVMRCEVGEGWGGSSSVQLPVASVRDLDGSQRSLVFPGRRRSEGVVSALTGGLSDRRSAVRSATLNALATIFFASR
jgi:non-canonical (house-cleaning) NTP pyrophosphatase